MTTSSTISLETRRLIARLRFRHLQLLIELQRGGSLRAAASVLHLTQPALSKALSEVESAFGFALFTRSARGLVATPRGDIAIRGAALLLEELAHVGREASADPASTLLRIGAPPFVAQEFLPRVFVQLANSDSRIRLDLMEARVPLLMASLLEGQLDALITSYPIDPPNAASAELRYEKLFDAEFVVIAPPGHVLGRARKPAWQRLAQERWILPGRTSMVRRLIEEVFRHEGMLAPVPVIESTSPVTNIRMVAAGLGISAVPVATLGLMNNPALVQRVRVNPPIPPNPVALIYRPTPDNPRIALLRKALGLA